MAGGASDTDDDVISAINVTPLVDVTLVLLVVFMVTARIIVSQGMPMDLPKAASGEAVQLIFSVELTQSGKTFVDSKEVSSDDAVLTMARDALKKNPDLRAVIRADKTVEHGRVIQMLDFLKQAKLSKIAFAVSPTKAADPKAPQPAAPAPQ